MRLAILGIILGCVWIARKSPLDLSPTDDSRHEGLTSSVFSQAWQRNEQVFSAPEQVFGRDQSN